MSEPVHCKHSVDCPSYASLKAEVERMTEARDECERQYQAKVLEVGDALCREDVSRAEIERLRAALETISMLAECDAAVICARAAIEGAPLFDSAALTQRGEER